MGAITTTVQYVKVTRVGKVTILIHSRMKSTFRSLLEMFLNEMFIHDKAKPALDRSTAQRLIAWSLISELYFKYHGHLHNPYHVRITLTQAQALAFWELCQEFEHFAYKDAEMGNILMQLHQKLS